jgi:uncharacterized protein (DUF1330 family)
VLLVALLTVERSRLDAFRRYETRAARIMAAHGGRIERALVMDGGLATLREMHVVRFADDAAFASYRADPALAALEAERDACIATTEVWSAVDGPDYLPPSF